jgi:hypothetical protein
VTNPTATIEVRAESQEQLQQMLVSLNEALNRFQTDSRNSILKESQSLQTRR